MTDLPALIREALAAAGDPTKAEPMRAYMKSSLPLRGVQASPLKALLRPLLADHPLPDRLSWEAAVLDLWDEAAFREERYAAEALAGHHHYRAHQDFETLGLYEHMIVTGAWWDHVDNIAVHRVGPILQADPETVGVRLLEWARSEDLWLRRAAIIAQLGARTETDADLLAEAIRSNLEGSRFGSEFFIRKAIGWALRQHAKTDPEWVVRFVNTHDASLSGLSRREALKHLQSL